MLTAGKSQSEKHNPKGVNGKLNPELKFRPFFGCSRYSADEGFRWRLEIQVTILEFHTQRELPPSTTTKHYNLHAACGSGKQKQRLDRLCFTSVLQKSPPESCSCEVISNPAVVRNEMKRRRTSRWRRGASCVRLRTDVRRSEVNVAPVSGWPTLKC